MQQMGVTFDCQYDTPCSTAMKSQPKRRIAPTVIVPSLPAPTLEARHVPVTVNAEKNPKVRIVEINRRLDELDAQRRQMRTMKREVLQRAIQRGEFPLPSDVTMERTLLRIERRELARLLAAKQKRAVPTKKQSVRGSGGNDKVKWTAKQVAALTNFLAGLDSRWIERPPFGMLVQLVQVIRPKNAKDTDERVEALLTEFTHLHPNGVLFNTVVENGHVSRSNMSVIELNGNPSLLRAFDQHKIGVKSALALVKSSGGIIRRPFFDSRKGGFLDASTRKHVKGMKPSKAFNEAKQAILYPSPRPRSSE